MGLVDICEFNSQDILRLYGLKTASVKEKYLKCERHSLWYGMNSLHSMRSFLQVNARLSKPSGKTCEIIFFKDLRRQRVET